MENNKPNRFSNYTLEEANREMKIVYFNRKTLEDCWDAEERS